jgi:hypothetical protein
MKKVMYGHKFLLATYVKPEVYDFLQKEAEKYNDSLSAHVNELLATYVYTILAEEQSKIKGVSEEQRIMSTC